MQNQVALSFHPLLRASWGVASQCKHIRTKSHGQTVHACDQGHMARQEAHVDEVRWSDKKQESQEQSGSMFSTAASQELTRQFSHENYCSRALPFNGPVTST